MGEHVHGRSVAQTAQSAAIIVLTLWAIFFSLDAFPELFWRPAADFGLATDASLKVISTDSMWEGSPSAAADAGMRIGDRLDPARVSFQERMYLQRVQLPPAGTSMRLDVLHNSSSRTVKLDAVQMRSRPQLVVFYVLVALVDFIFTVIGAVLVFYRRSLMTWGFFLGCIGLQQNSWFGMSWQSGMAAYLETNFSYIMYGAGYAGLLIFAARVPDDRPTGTTYYVQWLAPVVFVLLTTGLTISGWPYPIRAQLLTLANLLTQLVVPLWVIIVATLLTRLVQERGPQRARISWITGGFVILFAARAAANSSTLPDALVNIWLPALQIVMPLSVAYAIVRHHAFQAGVVANRALVYSLFLSALFCLIALSDWVVTQNVANSQMKIGLLVAVAVAFGFFLPALHRQAVRLIDRVFFRQRYETTLALEKLQASIEAPGAPRRPMDSVARDIAAALGVSSLAFFKRSADGGFIRYADAGWEKRSRWHILPEDELFQSLDLSRLIVYLPQKLVQAPQFPSDSRKPIVALAVSEKRKVEQLVLVGTMLRGDEVDHDSLRILASLARNVLRLA